MPTEHFHDLFWDYLYGLLDETEAQKLRAHVADCADCRLALAATEVQQHTLARAARVIQEVPAFIMPGQEAASPEAEVPAPAALPVSIPLPAPSPERRKSAWRRFGLAVAAAAAVLGIAFGLNDVYRDRLAQHQADLARVRNEVAAVDGRFAALRTNVEKEKQDKARLLREQLPPQIHVVGPGQVLAGAPLTLHVSARNVDGTANRGKIHTVVKDAGTGKVLHDQEDMIAGEGNIQVPGLKMERNAASIDIAGQRGVAANGTVRLAEPAHATQLALNKSLYYVGELLFFRTLTLDRFTLIPPAQPLALRFALLDANGRIVKELPGHTGPGGISGGEMALTPDLASGTYTFQVSAAAGTTGLVLPQSATLEIVRDETPQFAFDRNQYRGGDKIGYNLNLGVGQGQQAVNNAYANQPVTITLNADGRPVQQNAADNKGRAQFQNRLDNAGNVSGEVQLPQRVEKAEIVAEFGDRDGKNNKKVVQPIPVVPSEKTIDFFPEGGDLVAGVPNRVYFRVRSPQGEPVDPDGHVIILASKDVVYDSERRQGLGSFTFTPDPKEKYAVRITGADGVTEIQHPFEKLGIKTEGLVLFAPQSVSREGEPLTIVLRNQGAARRLWLQTTCRGQLVDQQYLELPRGSQEAKLPPAPGAAGIWRVTALEGVGDQLVPVAERLLYRVPAKRLDVSCEIANGSGPYAAGTNMALKLKALDETKKAGPTWMLAAVVDEKYRAEKRERGLAAHFYLAGEFGGEEVDNANLVLNDTPAARQALDLFLGTQGWRRFVQRANATLLAANLNADAAKVATLKEQAAKDAPTKDAPAKGTPAQGGLAEAEVTNATAARGAAVLPTAFFFSIENTSSQNLEQQYQVALQKEVSELIDRANRERTELLDQRDTGLQVLGQAVRDLAEFQQVPRATFRLALGFLTLGLLGAGGVFLAVGLVRLFRKKDDSPTACFAGAFSCLFACLILYLVAGRLPLDPLPADSLAAAPGDTWPEFTADPVKTATAPVAKNGVSAPVPVAPPLGYFAAAAAPVQEAQLVPAAPRSAPAVAADPLAKRAEGGARVQNFGSNQFQNLAQLDHQRQLRDATQVNDEMQRRFAQAETKAKEQVTVQKAKPMAAGKTAAPSPAGPGGIGGAKKADEDKSMNHNYYFREYAHRLPRQGGRLDLQDTLLWYPVLYSADGTAQVSFDLSQNLTTYRILLYANSPSGRLGSYEGHLEVRPATAK